MENWGLVKVGRSVRFNNSSRTRVHISPRVSKRVSRIIVQNLIEDLNEVQFPKKFLRGVNLVDFSLLRKYVGAYWDNMIQIDASRSKQRRTILATFVHEVAHHVDQTMERHAQRGLTEERRKRGHHIHHIARLNDEEYLARGFEKYYSRTSAERELLRRRNPKLHTRITSLNRRYRNKGEESILASLVEQCQKLILG